MLCNPAGSVSVSTARHTSSSSQRCSSTVARQRSQTARCSSNRIVSLGAAGLVFAAAGGEARHLPAFAVDVVSTHGAGDAFVGALAARLAMGSGMDDALRYAQAAAALHVSRGPEERAAITPDLTLRLAG